MLSVVALGLAVVLLVKVGRQGRRYRALNRLANNQRFMEHLDKTMEGIARVERRLEAIAADQERVTAVLRKCARTPAVQRFNAFDDVGSDLSFSVAILDGEGTGLIFTSLYGRDESRTYAKKVLGGASASRLSAEEESVLNEALSRI